MHLSALNGVNKRFFIKKSINSLQHAAERERALIGAVTAMANICGVELKPIHCVDSQGELSISIKPGAENQGWGACGKFGEQFAY